MTAPPPLQTPFAPDLPEASATAESEAERLRRQAHAAQVGDVGGDAARDGVRQHLNGQINRGKGEGGTRD